jgi:hypothetical protein
MYTLQCKIFILLVLLPITALCQQEKIRGFTAVGLMGSLDYTNRTLDYSTANESAAARRDGNEIGNTGFTIYSQVRYKLNNRVYIEGGVGYANRSYKTKSADLYWTTDDPSLPTKNRTIYRFKYITLPLNINYSIYRRNKIRLFATAGVATNIFLGKRTKVQSSFADGDESNYTFSKRAGYTTFTATIRGGIGLDYQVMKRFTLRMEPYYQRTIRSVTADDNAKEYIYAWGLATGVLYSF